MLLRYEDIQVLRFFSYFLQCTFLIYKSDKNLKEHGQDLTEFRSVGISKLSCMVPVINALLFIYS